MTQQPQPYRCVVCNGNGKVPNGFYSQTSGTWASASTEPEMCRTCSGTGVIWHVAEHQAEEE